MPRGDSSAAHIREAALALFFRHGVSGTSLRMVAEALGVSKAAVYYHYRTKEDIVRAVLEPAFATFSDLVSEADDLPPEERAAALVQGLARQAVVHRELYAVTLHDVTAAELRRGSQTARTFARMRDQLAGPDPDQDARVRAALFLSGLMAPAVDRDLATMDGAALEAAIIEAGSRLLGGRPRRSSAGTA